MLQTPTVVVLWNDSWTVRWRMGRVLVWLMYHTIRIRHNQETRWWVVLNILTSNFSDFENQSTKRFQTIDLKQKTTYCKNHEGKEKVRPIMLSSFLGLTQFQFWRKSNIQLIQLYTYPKRVSWNSFRALITISSMQLETYYATFIYYLEFIANLIIMLLSTYFLYLFRKKVIYI